MIRTANLTASISRQAGGLFDGVRRLVQSFPENRTRQRVFGLEDKFTQADLERWQPVDAFAFKSAWPKQFGYSPRFLEELLAFEPDLIHTHGMWVYPSVATTVFSRARRHPYLISPHGMLDPWAVRNSRRKKAVANFLYEGAHLRGARCLRALCEAEAHAIRQMGLMNDIVVIPNGIDLPIGPPPAGAPWNGAVEPGKKVLLFLGRIHPKKGLVNLLQAWASMQKDLPSSNSHLSSEWVLAIAGWDQNGHEQDLKDLATELGVSWTAGLLTTRPRTRGGAASVIFLGPQFNEAKAACYHFCDAFVLPSVSEGVPMAVLEAWAHSKPVVMTAECNLPAGFTAGAALKVETNSESIAEGLNQLVGMQEAERTAMGGKARALVAERFVWPRVAEEMQGVYEWMIGGGSKPSCLAYF
jgi:glycosyltransferase involved in cell wall biosynthesis